MREAYRYVSTKETLLASTSDFLVIEIISTEDNKEYIQYKIEAMPNRFSINITGPLPEDKVIDIIQQNFFKELVKYLNPYLPW